MEHNEDMIIDHIQRISQLELRVGSIEKLTESINGSLTKLTAEISAIKWVVIGSGMFLVLHEVGLVELLKSIFSK